jgi:hypothetical protein
VDRFYTSAEIEWLGPDALAPRWDGRHNRIGCVIPEPEGGALCLLFNASRDAGYFVLPSPRSGPWQIAIDTSKPAKANAPDDGDGELLADPANWWLEARSVVVLVSA